MKTVRLHNFNFPDGIVVEDYDEPQVAQDQVFIQVHAASVNPFDVFLAKGGMGDKAPIPFTLGGDVAGIVQKVGEGVIDLQVGDKVYGQAIILAKGSGSMAEYCVAPRTKVAHVPTSVSMVEAGGLPLVGVSAVQALTEHIGLQSGQKILIHGGAGGIGSTAIQLAKSIGAYVVTTVSTDDMDFVKGLGADEVIDYKEQKFEEIVHDMDAVFDTVGGETQEKSFSVLKPGGIIVSMKGQPRPKADQPLAEDDKHITAIGQVTVVTRERLEKLTELVDSGKIKIQIDKTFPLEKAKDAFVYQVSQSPRGKVVITMQ
ncbi:MAG TPA: NADP-dependent oxidoreductase [Candidatus Eisenbacteria bacterium]|nr:NADP-dependent oxidoreductase [Candidatus Eisenbacteria bacterium]